MAENVPQVGKLISDDEQRRDCIHVAICPVIAGEEIYPGDHVGFLNGSRDVVIGENHIDVVLIGIVDPYLKRPVNRGDRFWLFLYPGTVTSIRHLWTHPAFNKSTQKE